MAPECRRNRFRTIWRLARGPWFEDGLMPAAGDYRAPASGHDYFLLTWVAHAFTLMRGSSAAYGRSAMMLKTMAVMATTTKKPITGLGSMFAVPVQEQRPMPSHREDGFGDDGAADQRPDVEGDDRGDRDHGVAEGVPHDHGPLGEALGPRRPDVVLVQHLQHAGPGVPGVAGQRDQDQGQGRQDQVGEQSQGVRTQKSPSSSACWHRWSRSAGRGSRLLLE